MPQINIRFYRHADAVIVAKNYEGATVSGAHASFPISSIYPDDINVEFERIVAYAKSIDIDWRDCDY